MSSTAAAAKAAASDKVEVSFATDDEEETSSEESADAVTSSSESGDEAKSDGDGDADDESDMPTFTLSLQPSTGTSDVDDALPDLSLSAASSSNQETQQEAVTTTTLSLSGKTGASSETETKTETQQETIVTTTISLPEKTPASETGTKIESSQSTSASTEVDGVLSAEVKEKEPTATKVAAVPTKEEILSEASEESEETESEEEDVNHEEQDLPSSSTTKTSSSTTVSTKTNDTKEDSAVTSTKLAVTQTKTNVEVEEEEHVAIAVVQTKKTHSAEKSVKNYDSSVTKVEEEKHSAESKTEEKSSVKTEAVVAKQATDVNIDKDENKSGVSRTAASEVAKVEVKLETEAAAVSTVPASDPQASKKTKKETANKKVIHENTNADVFDSAMISSNIKEADDLKHEDIVKETVISTNKKAAKSSAIETTETKLPKPAKGEETNELRAKEQSETVEHSESVTSIKTKVDAKEIKQDVTKAVEEKQTASVVVVNEQNSDKSQSEKIESSKTINNANSEPKVKVKEEATASVVVTEQHTEKSQSEKTKTSRTVSDTKPEPKVNHEKSKEAAHKHDKSGEVAGQTTAVKTDKLKSAELIEDDVSISISETTKTSAVAVAVKETAAVTSQKEKVTATTEQSEGQLPSKKKSKDSGSTSELKDSVVKSADVVASSAAVAGTELEKKATETQSNKDKSLPTANYSNEVDDLKLNGVGDEGKPSLGADDEEFRPRRNSIDEFIKRILAEAREEQKKILDSCAVSSGGETPSETSASAVTTATVDGLTSPKGTEPEQQQQQQPVVNGLDVEVTTRTARRNREDFDIDDELADISRYLAKRTLVDRVPTNDDETAKFGSATQADDITESSKIIANGDERLPLTNLEDMLHFVPQRRETTAVVVRESMRPVKILVEQQTHVIRQLTETSRAIDELDNEIRQLRQATGGREALFASIGTAIRDELRVYEMELTAAGERLGRQRLPGGGRFVREQFLASELLQRTVAANGPPRLERAASVDEWARVGRRRSGSFSAPVDEDAGGGGGSRSGIRQWLQAGADRVPTDLMIQYRQSRSGSVASDRGYSSTDTVDEVRVTTSSLLSRLAVYNATVTATELDTGAYSRLSSESRPSYSRSQSISDDWLSTASSNYSSVGRQYVGYGLESTEDANGEPDVGYRVGAGRPPVQPSHRRYQPPSVDPVTATTTPSRLYVRRGSLQSYGSYDSGTGSDAGRSFNSRFLSRVREKKALGETTTSRQTGTDRPFRSRFLKSSSVTGSTSTTSRSSVPYDSEDD